MHWQQADLIIVQITAILAHFLYVNGPILTGNTAYSKQNWVTGKWWILKDPAKLIQMPSAGQSAELCQHFHDFHRVSQ